MCLPPYAGNILTFKSNYPLPILDEDMTCSQRMFC